MHPHLCCIYFNFTILTVDSFYLLKKNFHCILFRRRNFILIIIWNYISFIFFGMFFTFKMSVILCLELEPNVFSYLLKNHQANYKFLIKSKWVIKDFCWSCINTLNRNKYYLIVMFFLIKLKEMKKANLWGLILWWLQSISV